MMQVVMEHIFPSTRHFAIIIIVAVAVIVVIITMSIMVESI